MSHSSTMPSHPEPVVFSWEDSEPTGAVGWVVADRFTNGVAGGGIFCHAAASLQEVKDIARNMSRKFTVTDPQIGGAKAGLRFDHKDPRFGGVLERFIYHFRALLRSAWVTAGDLNTDDSVIESIIQRKCGLPTCQYALASKIAEAQGGGAGGDRSRQLARWIAAPASPHFPLIEGAVGFGLMTAAVTAHEECCAAGGHPSLAAAGSLRLVAQGFGAVGSSLAHFWVSRGVGRVVALADVDGILHDSRGLDIGRLLRIRDRAKADQSLSNDVRARAQKNIVCCLTEAERREFGCVLRPAGTSDGAFLEMLLAAEEAEVFCPCAQRYQVTDAVARCLVAKTWAHVPPHYRLMAAGANNAFGVVVEGEDKKAGGTGTSARLRCDDAGTVQRLLAVEAGACVVPDWVANSGTAQLFHRVLSCDYSTAEEILDACGAPIARFLRAAFSDASHPTGLPVACEALAARRLAFPLAMSRGGGGDGAGPEGDRKTGESATAPAWARNRARSRYCLPPLPPAQQLPLERRVELCARVASDHKEGLLSRKELEQLLRDCPNPVAYDGFEPSGRMHIAQGLVKMGIIKGMTDAGFTYILWIADLFAQLNHKMGGDLEKIRTLGRYFIEIWAVMGREMGVRMDRVRYLWAEEEILARPSEYLARLIDIATTFTVARVAKCSDIQGRGADANPKASSPLYSMMQCADVGFLGVDVAQLGLDQLKVNMLASEYADCKDRKMADVAKPVVISHTMLPGLRQTKMSKSDPASAIYMEDSADDVAAKIKGAFCAERDTSVATNPVLAYLKFGIFEHPRYSDAGVNVDRDLGGGVARFRYRDYAALSVAFGEGQVSPQALKATLVRCLNEVLEPVRRHFASGEPAALFEQVKKLRASF